MKISRKDFLRAPVKAITLLGMSGVGKTHFSTMLEQSGWVRYSCDYEIGNVYLKDRLGAILDCPDDIGALSAFIGKIGDPEKGGLPYETFLERQKFYYDAECQAIGAAIEKCEELSKSAKQNFVHDSTGSLCEIMDSPLIARLGQASLFVYFKAGDEAEKQVLERAQIYPKPLFFPPLFFPVWVEEFMREQHVEEINKIDPDAFSRWVFPKLFYSRLPKYQKLADAYGITIPCSDLYNVRDEQDFIALIARGLDDD